MSTKSIVKLAFNRERGPTMNVAIGALIELGAEELVDKFTLSNYLPNQGGCVGVKKADLAPYLEKPTAGEGKAAAEKAAAEKAAAEAKKSKGK